MLRSVIAALLLLVAHSAAQAEKRVALVIGNGSYVNVGALANPARDAEAIKGMFQAAGFDIVEMKNDLGALAMRRALRDFSDRVREADIAAVFYAGHGIEVNGVNYLIPVDALLERDIDVEDETVPLDRVTQILEQAKRLRLVILDACRDNPFLRSMRRTVGNRAIGRGLAEVRVLTSDTLIAFAARAGSTASDGSESNSPYTMALVKHLTSPGLDLRLALGRVRDEVLKTTANKQEPFVYGSLGGGEIALLPAKPQSSSPAPRPSSEAAEAWDRTRESTSIAALEAFIARYKDTYYAELARLRIEDLKKQQVATSASPGEQRSTFDPKASMPRSPADVIERVKPSVVSVHVTRRRNSPAPFKFPEPGKADQGDGQDSGTGQQTPPTTAPDAKGEQSAEPESSRTAKGLIKSLPTQPDYRGSNSADGVEITQGSGFLISADGFVVTSNHVVDGAQKIQISLDAYNKFDGEVVGVDNRTDIALLRIKSQQAFPFVKFTEQPPRVGDWVVAIGNPFGFGGTATAGMISATDRDIGSGPYDYIQIDAAVNRGNSGGPVFNSDGEVIGISNAIYSPSGGSVGIAFAIPAKIASSVVADLKSTGAVSRGWLGVQLQDVNEEIAKDFGLSDPKGVLIVAVTPRGPAEVGGIKNNDVLLNIDGSDIRNSRDLSRVIGDLRPDTVVKLQVVRNKAEQTIAVKLGKQTR
jgi:S1-C subfamily serine protease